MSGAVLTVKGDTLRAFGRTFRCAIGKGGYIPADAKREGDGATPLGRWALRECWYRPDRMEKPATGLPVRAIQQDDGRCDDPTHPQYNTHVKLPFPGCHETLWREDHAYDLIVPLGYNDGPIVPGKGSAIFLHVAKPGYPPTEGCVALAREELWELLPQLSAEYVLDIQG